ncbi:MAG: hypothetical protein FJY82_02255 [Candidatus Aminicenantes bacterium]|nr:hypothetical protein [Candidatus Aminicenantes bacterium]
MKNLSVANDIVPIGKFKMNISKCFRTLKDEGRIVLPLEGGNYLCLRQNRFEKSPVPEEVFCLLDGEFREIAILDRRTTYDPDTLGFRGIVSQPVLRCVLAGGHLYLVNEKRGYEILKYDQTGKLVRKIRKEAVPVEIAEDVKRERTKMFEGMGGKGRTAPAILRSIGWLGRSDAAVRTGPAASMVEEVV